MTTMQSIVVGYDASPESELALNWAITRAERTGAEVHLVKALSSEYVIDVLANDQENPDGLRLPGLDRARAALGEDRVRITQAAGSPVSALVEASGSSDLLVMGTRDRNPLVAGLVGSTAYAVTAHASCPVVVVRSADGMKSAPIPGEGAPVIVGVEGVEESKDQLEAAARIAADYGAPLRLVRVTDTVTVAAMAAPGAVPAGDIMRTLQDGDTIILEECEAYVKQTHPELVVEQARVDGDPAHALVEQQGALIVVGSRGRGGFAGLLLGSVSHAVIHAAECPVLVLRSHKR